MEAHFYTVDINWSRDRKGVMCSPELSAATPGTNGCIEVATPPQFPKGMPGIWSPEHLFTAAVSSCLMTTFLAIAENSKLEFSSFNCHSKGKLEQVEGKFMMTEVLLEPHVVILHEKDRERAERVIQKSEAACLISNSIRSKVIMNPRIEVASATADIN
ncbi:MAG: OsmC family protein [Chitinophagaceae bacterium]|jgi:peroxiredoxin-like protein|nr:OsmC family protein [Chitinophagaceae bacterium]OQY96925.1 MAG: osmotically inducible protein OsmC [Sphingobacteriales bacterium UTBCD1]